MATGIKEVGDGRTCLINFQKQPSAAFLPLPAMAREVHLLLVKAAVAPMAQMVGAEGEAEAMEEMVEMEDSVADV